MSRSRKLFVPALLSAVALTAGSMSVYAQTAEGSLYGKAKPGSQVVVSSPDTGTSRTVTVDGSGNYQVSRLSPGKYVVKVDGADVDVFVTIGTGTFVEKADSLQTVDISSGRAGRIDFASTEANVAFTQSEVQALPVALDVTSVALLAPTVVKGDSFYGNLPSFAGSSVLENGFYINGFDVTNIRNFDTYADLPYEAVAQQQVKSGGYGAEYGRSLGGVISLVTKRGTNEWHGGATVSVQPSNFRTQGRVIPDKQYPGYNLVFSKYNTLDRKDYTAYLGGPVIKDRLFVFGLINKPDNTADVYESTQSHIYSDSTPSGLLKIDLNIADGHTFEATGIYNKARHDIVDFENAKDYSTTHDGLGARSHYIDGGTVAIGKYTGALTDNLTLSLLAGRTTYLTGDVILGARTKSLTCPAVLNESAQAVGCWDENLFTARDGSRPADEDVRKAYRVDVDYKLGDHQIKAGLDSQKFDSAAAGLAYSGGVYYRYYVVGASATGFKSVNGVQVASGTPYVRVRDYRTTSGTYAVDNDAWYLEDTWKVNDRLMVYGGLRGESFNNKNGANETFVKADNLLAPRLGFSFDATGDRTTKIYGNAGRYYIPVASNANIRATQGVIYTTKYYTYTGKNSTTQAPVTLGSQLGTTIDQSSAIPNSATIADTKLAPMNQDEFILGLEHRLEAGWKIGAKLIYRKVNDGMDDFCDTAAFERFAESKNYTNFDPGSLAQCVLVNPGRDVNIAMDINGDGKLVVQTLPASLLKLAKYERTYQALEMSAERPFDGKWGLKASYVYSKSRGTAEGYAQSTLKQLDAGITQDFDYASFTDGAYGALPNDRTHVFKIYGNYQISQHVRAGFNATAASGRPKNCIGYVPPSVFDYDGSTSYPGSGSYSSASSYYCSDDNGKTRLVPRGTVGRTPFTLQLDTQVAYVRDDLKTGKFTVQADIFNLMNSRKAITVFEQRDFSRATTDGVNNELNLNYGAPTGFQPPRSIRVTARYEF